MMTIVDPYHGVEFTKAVDKLVERFGAKHVTCHPATDGSVDINMPVRGESLLRPVKLTARQAKYLAFNPQITFEDLRDKNLPNDWPPTI